VAVFVGECLEASVVSVYAGRRDAVIWRWSRNQGLGLHELLQTCQRTHGTL